MISFPRASAVVPCHKRWHPGGSGDFAEVLPLFAGAGDGVGESDSTTWAK